MSNQDQYQQDVQAVDRATRLTVENIEKLLEDSSDPAVSMLAVEERKDLIDEIARIVPAGNVISFVLNGVLTSKERQRQIPDTATGRNHLSALFKGLSVMKNNLMYQVMFAGPATVLAGYNKLLELAGAKPEDFLPEGAWQFYVEFGLREDAARHQSETTGFHATTARLQPTEANELSAWVIACLWLMRDYESLLELIWEEHARLTAIEDHTSLNGLHKQWLKLRPFAAPNLDTNFTTYRQQQFEGFCNHYLRTITKNEWITYSQNWLTPEKQEEVGRRRRAYVKQLSIHRYLEPGEYSDERYPVPPEARQIAVVYGGNYYLLKAIDPLVPGGMDIIWQQVTNILNHKADPIADIDAYLVTLPRATQQRIRATLAPNAREELERLRKAPIIINWDRTERNQPLTFIRSGKRGIGDHALTVFRTRASMVFDFSHIFFDGPWAMAVAEILTNEATKYLTMLQTQTHVARSIPLTPPLALNGNQKFIQAASRQPRDINYMSAECSKAIAPLNETRRLLSRAHVRLTINDLLVLYRVVFNQRYIPSADLQAHLQQLSRDSNGRVLARQIDAMIANLKNSNPSLLIPIDGSRYDPKERIFPSTFRNPLPDFHHEHQNLLALREQARQRHMFRSNSDAIDAFIKARQDYLGYLSAFGKVMQAYRTVATSGESMGAAAIRLIAGLPEAMQKIADDIPGHLSVVNEAIKGEEVFSNVGLVALSSSIARFASAKDDNNKKVLVWGIMTDANGMLYITLRDFRPPVLDLVRANETELAQFITYDFLQAYVEGLFEFAGELNEIIATSKKRR